MHAESLTFPGGQFREDLKFRFNVIVQLSTGYRKHYTYNPLSWRNQSPIRTLNA